ncbi:peptidoglycan DD-metalloendopeptidase family protein [Glutamicibacter soli]|uniref:Peptidoglycan DD-metalloendopeptidase family protein n=1 Tax=Glutamicibacter soli TaxID=453836 RepID=A0A6L9GBK8_9MICC|nr:peptidoglycan DD-metalloendopeptidase family protein [Glutamicibacter soli]NAZ17880.1 peptidoglycan DD-metalloendopeptidase family protein [Glutamicibacter soli]
MTNFSSPVPKGARYTSAFGRRWGTLHAGDDYAPIKPGDHDPIYAAADGTVKNTGTGILAGHTGNIVIIDHGLLTGNGSSDYTLTNYGHMSKILVEPGQHVHAGQLIGYMGATGNVTGVHAHCGVRFKKKGTKSYKWASFHKWMKSKGITPGKTAPRKASETYRNLSLKNKSKGDDVLAVARALRSEGYTRQGDTRVFTAQLDVNVRDFQRRTGLVVDGVAAEITQKRLGI